MFGHTLINEVVNCTLELVVNEKVILMPLLFQYCRLPKGDHFQRDDHKEYDKAHIETDDCLARYPGCEDLHESMLL